MRLHVVEQSQAPSDPNACLVVPTFENDPGTFGGCVSEDAAKTLSALVERGQITGKREEVFYLPTPGGAYGGVLALGLGKAEDFNAEIMRRAAGTTCATLSANKHSVVVFDGSGGAPLPVEAFVEGVMLGQYDFTTYKKPDDDAPVLVEEMLIVAPSGEGLEELREGCAREALTCQSVNWARDLANTPPNDMTPNALAAQANSMAEHFGCDCTIFDESQMEEAGLNGILAVSKGSSEPARMIVLDYRHPDAEQTFAIIGKGITFDTGGISIKPGPDMHEMKFDMCGAAAVLGAMRTVCQSKPRVNVIGVVPAAENKTGPAAYVPGDIVTCYNGKTVEVHNTDAEGRMLLADALAYTERTYKPDAMIDLATLTGACVVALGHYAAGVFSNDGALVDELEVAAEASGERIWPLPLWEDYAKLVKGTHADLCNIGPRGEAGAVTAACFLREFVEDTPWAHIDIAGTAWGGKNIAYLDPNHATGYGVRLISQWILDQED